MNTITQTIKQIVIELTDIELEQLNQGTQICDALAGEDDVTVRIRKKNETRPHYENKDRPLC